MLVAFAILAALVFAEYCLIAIWQARGRPQTEQFPDQCRPEDHQVIEHRGRVAGRAPSRPHQFPESGAPEVGRSPEVRRSPESLALPPNPALHEGFGIISLDI